MSNLDIFSVMAKVTVNGTIWKNSLEVFKRYQVQNGSGWQTGWLIEVGATEKHSVSSHNRCHHRGIKICDNSLVTQIKTTGVSEDLAWIHSVQPDKTILTKSLLLYRYLLRPLESFTSLLKTRDISKRKRCRSRPFRIRVLGSQTWKDSWSISSPWESMFPSNPEVVKGKSGKNHLRGLSCFCSKCKYVCRRQVEIIYFWLTAESEIQLTIKVSNIFRFLSKKQSDSSVTGYRQAKKNILADVHICIPTLQHREVHGIVGSLGDTEHHFQAILDLPFSFLTAC